MFCCRKPWTVIFLMIHAVSAQQQEPTPPQKKKNLFAAIKQPHPGEMSHTAAFSRFPILLLFQRGRAARLHASSLMNFLHFLPLSLSHRPMKRQEKVRRLWFIIETLHQRRELLLATKGGKKKRKKKEATGAAAAERGGASRDV